MRLLLTLPLLLAFASTVDAGALDNAECVVPAKPGGGFELSCKLAQAALAPRPLRIAYLPGGIGAMAYHGVLTQRPADPHAIFAFSAGSLLNIAQGRFGPHSETDVRWVAALGLDHGVVMVRRDAPFTSLQQLLAALHDKPNAIVFGAAGTIGSQDWMKVALLARAAGVGHKQVRFVAFEGGGDAFSALAGGHVHVVAGDATEAVQQLAAGAPIRVLAVLAPERLPGPLAAVPTAREQGVDVQWPIVRGFYVGPRVRDDDYREWVAAFDAALAAPGFAKERAAAGLAPLSLTGAALDEFVRRSTEQYRMLAKEFGLPVRPRR